MPSCQKVLPSTTQFVPEPAPQITKRPPVWARGLVMGRSTGILATGIATGIAAGGTGRPDVARGSGVIAAVLICGFAAGTGASRAICGMPATAPAWASIDGMSFRC